nr:MAG TPA: hypothetical protein [Caudoviricetes sp.]
MADYTKYLRLMKPLGNEYYNVENFNHNAELIDKETEKLNTAVTKIQEGATREKAGIVQFGTEEGKALEGMMLARLAGCVGYGGDIQTAGTKDVNYIYYDRNTRKMYKCLNQNSDVSANVANFIPLDNNSLLDRLENLISHEKITGTTGMTNVSSCTSYITKIGNFVMCSMNIGVITDYAKTIIKSPIQFKEGVFISLEDNNGDLYATNRLPVVGWYNSATQTFEVANVNAGFTVLLIGRI